MFFVNAVMNFKEIMGKRSFTLLKYLLFLMCYITFCKLEFSFGIISFQPAGFPKFSFSYNADQRTINSLHFILHKNVFVFILEKYFYWIHNSVLIVSFFSCSSLKHVSLSHGFYNFWCEVSEFESLSLCIMCFNGFKISFLSFWHLALTTTKLDIAFLFGVHWAS